MQWVHTAGCAKWYRPEQKSLQYTKNERVYFRKLSRRDAYPPIIEQVADRPPSQKGLEQYANKGHAASIF